MESDNFINIPFTTKNLGRYVIRNSILKAVNTHLPDFRGNLLDIGCGRMPYKKHILDNSATESYTGLDIENAIEYDNEIKPDYTWKGDTMPFSSDFFDTAIGTEVLEHCPYPEIILKEVFRVLKPGGIFFFTTPFFWTLHEVPHDEYRFTPFSLERMINNAGFKEISVKATGGWHASLAQMLGAWVKRAPLKPRQKKLFSIIIKPLMAYLLKKDNPPVNFKSNQMLTTLYGTAVKQ